MEDIIDKLREHAEDVPVPLELPSEDELLEVEETLLIPLPDDYKVFLLEVSDIVLGYLEPATIADPTLHTYLPDMAAHAWEAGIARELIPICALGGDEFYCLTMNNRVVKCAPHDPIEDDDENSWSSIWDWAEDVWLGSANT